MTSASLDPIFTNVHVYRDIAVESLHAAEALLEAHRRPKEDGKPGYILSPDPNHRSLKQSLIAIAFAGMFIDATFWLYGTQKLGVDKYRKIDRMKLEERLRELSIEDEALAAKLKAYREARNELVHEKAVPFLTDRTPIRIAQKEARRAVELMLLVERALRNAGLTRSAV